MKPFIGIKELYYGTALTAAPQSIKTLTSSMTKITNVHDGTWAYSQDDPDVTDYVNELTGQNYYRDMNSHGTKTINFTIGEYDFATRAALQGGTVTNGVWAAPTDLSIIEKCIVAITKTGNYICFPKASIVAKVDTQEKNLGLGITATAMEATDASGNKLSEEYWEDGSYAG